MDNIYIKILNKYPDILSITKPIIKEIISYGNNDLIYPLLWIYKYFFNYDIFLFLPKYKNLNLNFDTFNDFVGDEEYFIKDVEIVFCDLETLENFKSKGKNTIVLFLYFDFIYTEIHNKKRLDTLIKKIKKNKIHILSYCSHIKLKSLESFIKYECKNCLNLNYSLIDILNDDEEIYESNIECLIETISYFVSENKTVYLSLNLPIPKIKEIEKLIKDLDINITRKETENSQVVINSSKTTENNFLKNKYSVYIFILPTFDEHLELISYIKDSFDGDIYIDSENKENVKNCLKTLSKNYKSTVIKDSNYFKSYEEMGMSDYVIVSESYYNFTIKSLNLDISNLSKKDYEQIRNFIKLKLNGKLDLDIKTCQICSPSSPKDYSKKLNSLMNKINFFQFRCDITCEIFKDHSIGIVVWNEMFKNKSYKIEPNQTFVYQTTNGDWRYTTIN